MPEACLPPPRATWQVTTEPRSAAPWHCAVTLTLPGDPGEHPVPTVHERWQLALDLTIGAFDLTGEATNTPAFALINLATVACADPGTGYPPPTPPMTRLYSCHTRVPPNPDPPPRSTADQHSVHHFCGPL